MTNKITQAAANKAAEEGGLPALPKAKMLVGQHLDSLHVLYSAEQVRDAQRAAIVADRASRQVANKEVQEARAAYKDRPTYDEKVSIGSRDFFEMLIEYGKEPSLSKRMEIADFVDSHIDKLVANKAEVEPVAYCAPDKKGKPLFGKGWMFSPVKQLQATMPLYATPPATTGASTVLTDERIEKMWDKAFGSMDIPPAAYTFAREVAAQAGQVAEKDRLLKALERAAIAESALRRLADEVENDAVPGWEDRLMACIAEANSILNGSGAGQVAPADLQVRRATDELSLPELAEQFAAAEALGCDYTLSAKVCGKLFRAMTTPPDDSAGQVAVPDTCTLPPEGWYCTRQAGHDGPCAAWPCDQQVEYLAAPSPAKESK